MIIVAAIIIIIIIIIITIIIITVIIIIVYRHPSLILPALSSRFMICSYILYPTFSTLFMYVYDIASSTLS